MFSNVKQNDRLVIVESVNDFKVYTATVTEVGSQTTVMNSQNQAVKVVSYIKCTDGQQPFELKEIPVNADLHAYPNGTAVATSNEEMAKEMRRLNSFSRSIINSVPQHNAIIAGTERVLEQIDPEYAEKVMMRQQLELLKQQNEELLKSREDFKKEIASLRNDLKTSKSK